MFNSYIMKHIPNCYPSGDTVSAHSGLNLTLYPELDKKPSIPGYSFCPTLLISKLT